MGWKPRRGATGYEDSRFPPRSLFSSPLRHFLLDSGFFFCHTRLMCQAEQTILVQGRALRPSDLAQISQLVVAHPDWSRWRLSRELAAEGNWRNPAGQLKDMAARSLLVKLAQRGWIPLPARRQTPTNRMRARRIAPQFLDSRPLAAPFGELGPREVHEVSRDGERREILAAALAEFHYLGYRSSVGENLQYLITQGGSRVLAGLLFGSAAWKCSARDRFIGWNPEARERNLALLSNNQRLLILPWVRVQGLGSWILGRVLRRLSSDWRASMGMGSRLWGRLLNGIGFGVTSSKPPICRGLGGHKDGRARG